MDLRNLMDTQTKIHCKRVSLLCSKMLKELNKESKELLVAAELHDVGKHLIPEWLLNAPRGITSVERFAIDMHSAYGYLILKEQGYSELTSQIVLFHHGLEKVKPPGVVISPEAAELSEILHTADVYDALISSRPYKTSLNEKDALNILKSEVTSQLYEVLQQVIKV